MRTRVVDVNVNGKNVFRHEQLLLDGVSSRATVRKMEIELSPLTN